MRVKISETNKLPLDAGFYAVLKDENTVLYVGKTISLRNRWYSHSLKPLFKHLFPNSYIEYIKYDDMEIENDEEVDFYEKEFIKIWRPEYNKYDLNILDKQL